MGFKGQAWVAASALTLSTLVAGCHPKAGSSKPYSGPAHVFTPRTHPPRTRVQAPPQSLADLPPVIDRIDACAAEPEPEKPAEPQGSVTSVVSIDQAKNIPVGGQSRDFTSVVDLSPTASADASGIRLAGTSGVSLAPPRVEAPKVHVDSGWGEAVYLSNDDTMSLSAAQRILYAIDRNLPIDPRLLRPHEFLNYFSFESAPVAPGDDFSVLPSLAPRSGSPGSVDLALAIQGRTIDRAARRNANLALVVDRSGSMREEGRMDYLKRGLRRMVDELKRGDVVHLVVFNERVCVPLEGFVVGRDAPALLERAIDALVADGSTDLDSGLRQGYALADGHYRPDYNNRVLLITDALTNTGETDPEVIAMVGEAYDRRRVRLSGVGVGSTFNDELLDDLTERGKGAYVFLGSEAEVDAIFGARFISLLETTALNVHFRLHLPPSLRLDVFRGEEASAHKEEVQPIHYFAGTGQLFAAELVARGDQLRPQDSIMLTIEYEDPESGAAMVEERAWRIGDITGESTNIRKARVILEFVEQLARLVAIEDLEFTRTPTAICDEGSAALDRLSEPVAGDPEIRRIRSLWSRRCAMQVRLR